MVLHSVTGRSDLITHYSGNRHLFKCTKKRSPGEVPQSGTSVVFSVSSAPARSAASSAPSVSSQDQTAGMIAPESACSHQESTPITVLSGFSTTRARVFFALALLAVTTMCWAFSPVSASDESFNYYSQGNRLLTSGRFKDALAFLDKAIAIDPTLTEAYQCKGLALSKLHDYEGALTVFQQVLRLNPKNSPAYCNRGYCYMQLGRLDEALADLNHCLELSPSLNNAVSNRAEVYLRKGELEKAIADCTQAIAEDDLDADPFITRADAYMKQGLTKEALKDYTSAIEINPDPVNMFHPEGYSYWKRAKIYQVSGATNLARKDLEAVAVFKYTEPKPSDSRIGEKRLSSAPN